jgi:WD40 repeat protein
VSLGADRTVRLWDVAQGKEVRSFDLAQSEGETAARSAAFSPDGKTLLVAGVEAVELWSGEQWETRATLRAEPAPDAATCGLGEVYSARFSADGQQIVTGCGDKSVKIWTAKDGKLVRSFEVSGDEPGVVFSPDGKTIAVSLLDDTPVTLYETATGKTLRGLDKETSLAYDLSFSPDGKSLIASTLGGDIILCNVADGTVLRKLSSGLSSNDVVAFSPNGKLIATGGTNQNVLVWETASGKLLWKALRQAGE